MPDQGHVLRRPWIAALLSLLGGPLGQMYAGCGKRFLLLSCFTVLLIPLAHTIAVTLPSNRFIFIAFMLSVFCYPIFIVVDAFRQAKRAAEAKLKWFQRWWIYALACIAYLSSIGGVSKLTRDHIAEAFVVPAGSMSPAIAAGDRLYVSKISGGAGAIDYGDVVAFYSEGPASPLYLHRVIALGGDTIEIVNEEVFLNGKKAEDPHANFGGELPTSPALSKQLTDMPAMRIPDSSFFVLGDSRRASRDSRFLGPIQKTHYIGTAVRVYWPGPKSVNKAKNEANQIAWERVGLSL